MAQVEYEITYNPPGRNSYSNFLLIWAVLGIVLTFVIGNLLVPFLKSHGAIVHFAYWFTFSLFAGAVYVAVPYLVAVSSSQANRLNVGKEGLGFPASVHLIPGITSWRTWSDLRQAQVVLKDPGIVCDEDYLLLKYKNGSDIRMSLLGFDLKDLEHLFLSIEVWGKHCQRSDALLDFQDQLQNKNKGITGDATYTRIWEDELARRFNCTTFVPIEPGTLIGNGRLRILRQIAFGGTSAVYLARDKFHNEVVVKESVTGVDAKTKREAKAIEFFEREAKLLMVLKNPQIAKVLDHFVENGRQYLVLEFVPGQNLRQLIQKVGSIAEKRVLELALQMANILDYLHSQHPPVLHRDFSPDNLVLRPDGKLVLIDFGAANEFIGTATGTLVGKQCYMPPEQVRGKTEPASDLYAMGCTIFFLLTGHDPEGIDGLVAQLTAMETNQRPQSAQLIAIKCEELLDQLRDDFLAQSNLQVRRGEE
jgi:predicted Ser/Thr protein kinase